MFIHGKPHIILELQTPISLLIGRPPSKGRPRRPERVRGQAWLGPLLELYPSKRHDQATLKGSKTLWPEAEGYLYLNYIKTGHGNMHKPLDRPFIIDTAGRAGFPLNFVSSFLETEGPVGLC
jgi:hypothetical protein